MDPSYKKTFDDLTDTKCELIYNFKTYNNKVLPIYSLSDYIFYRQCFKNDDNIIPFQFMTCSDKSVKIVRYNRTWTNEDPIELNNRNIVLFNIYDNCNIISWDTFISEEKMNEAKNTNEIFLKLQNELNVSSKHISFCELNTIKQSTEEFIAEPSIGESVTSSILDSHHKSDKNNSLKIKHEKILELMITCEGNIRKDLIKKSEVTKKKNRSYYNNEFDLLIHNMMHLFWNIVIETDKNIKYDFPTEYSILEKDIKNQINDEIQKKTERELFAMNRYDESIYENMNDLKPIFTDDVIGDIISNFKTNAIKHSIYGYYTDDNDYVSDEIKIYFGFYKR
jgi:hypothetical protein